MKGTYFVAHLHQSKQTYTVFTAAVKENTWLFTNALQPGEPVRWVGELVVEVWVGAPDQVQQHKQILEEKKQGRGKGNGVGELSWETLSTHSEDKWRQEARSHNNQPSEPRA